MECRNAPFLAAEASPNVVLRVPTRQREIMPYSSYRMVEFINYRVYLQGSKPRAGRDVSGYGLLLHSAAVLSLPMSYGNAVSSVLSYI